MRSFNPFKLWGSWIGAIFGFMMSVTNMEDIWIFKIGDQTFAPGMLVNMIGAFCLGYGLHLMIRELSKNDRD